MDPVTTVEYDPQTGDYIRQLDNILKNKFGYVIDRQGFGKFLFDNKAVASLRGHISDDAGAAAVIAAPYVLKRGEVISGHRNHKGNGSPSVTFGAPAILNGERGNIGVAVLFADKNRVHALEILAPDGSEFILPLIEKTTSTRADIPNKTGLPSPNADIVSGNTVPQAGKSVKIFSEKNSGGRIWSAAMSRGLIWS